MSLVQSGMDETKSVTLGTQNAFRKVKKKLLWHEMFLSLMCDSSEKAHTVGKHHK